MLAQLGLTIEGSPIEPLVQNLYKDLSDAGIALSGDGPVHARYYGTFPRKLRRYVPPAIFDKQIRKTSQLAA